jgi:ribose transport system permease protein
MAQTVALPSRSRTLPRIDVTRVLRANSYAFALVLAAGLLIANLATDHGGFGWTDQLANVAPMAIAGIASAPSIIGGGFDLTISPLMFLTNCIFVAWLAPHGLGGIVSIPIMLAVGVGVGILDGLLIVGLRVQPIVVTLAMYFILQGVDLQISPQPATVSTGWVGHLANNVGPIPGALFTMGLPLLIWFGLRYVPFRRLLYAIGSNDATAYSSGVNVSVVRVASYALGGLFASIGGFALTALVSSTNSSNSTEYTLLGIAALALGGTSLSGGRGGLLGAIFGAFTIYLLQNLLAAFGVDPAYLQVVYGGMLVVAVSLGGMLNLRKKKYVPSRRSAIATVDPGGLDPPPPPAAGTPGVAPDGPTVAPQRVASAVALAEAPTVAFAPAGAVSVPAAPVNGVGSARTAAAVASETALSPEVGASERRTSPWARFGELQARYPILQVIALIAVFIYGTSTLQGLGSWSSIRSILVIAALVGLASAGQTMLILMGGFDLGVSGFIVASALTVTALSAKYNIPFGWCIVIAAVGSGLLGALAGQICHRYKINPLIVTLAMGTIAVGTVQVLNSGLTSGGAPQWLTNLTYPSEHTFGIHIPPLVAIWIVVALIFAVFLFRTTLGRRLFATGANERAAQYALIDTRRVWTATFAFSAIASALVGVLIAGFAGTVAGNLGDPYLFQSVVSVIVGGTIFGGPGDYIRTCVGALFLTVLTTVLVGHGASPAGEQIIYGVIILAAITIYGRQRALRDRL